MRTEKEKGIICLLLTFLAVLGVFAGGYRPKQNVCAAEDFRLWRQLDDRWGNTPIGGTTLRRSGCYVTSIAMVAVASGARSTDNFNPGVFARQLNNMGAFNSGGGLMSWASVNRAVSEISIATGNLNFRSGDQSGKAKELKAYLDKGMYVICNVGGHWVYIDGVIGNDVYMADPAKDEILMFKAYNNANITCYQALNGKNPYKGFTPLNAKPVVTTTTTSTTTTTTTTTTAATTTAIVTSVVSEQSDATRQASPSIAYKTGEYFCNSNNKTKIFADPDDENSSFAELNNGNVVNVVKVNGRYGEVTVGGKKGWVDLSCMKYAENVEIIADGDVNNDGQLDTFDLALVNEYIASRDKLTDGISVLTQAEIKAADLSGDGKIDNTDLLMYLMLICK